MCQQIREDVTYATSSRIGQDVAQWLTEPGPVAYSDNLDFNVRISSNFISDIFFQIMVWCFHPSSIKGGLNTVKFRIWIHSVL